MTLPSVFGIQQTTSFLGNPKTALSVIILMGVWQFGSSMLIFLSALKQIPHALYESAMVDGAKPAYTFVKITLPMLTPTIFFNLILQLINGFRVFTESYCHHRRRPSGQHLVLRSVFISQGVHLFRHGLQLCTCVDSGSDYRRVHGHHI